MGAFVNNATFRARARDLTQTLLCRDIHASLNIDLIGDLVNPDLSDEVRVPSSNEECAGCHLVLDNMMSVFSNYFQYFYGVHPDEARSSEAGYVFGKQGEGPAFLMQQLIDHKDFVPCMARRAWEDISGTPWEDLPIEENSLFLVESRNGPRSLIQAIMTSRALKRLRR